LGDDGKLRIIRIPGCRTVLIDAASVEALFERGRLAAING
jgi:hypothetical protein